MDFEETILEYYSAFREFKPIFGCRRRSLVTEARELAVADLWGSCPQYAEVSASWICDHHLNCRNSYKMTFLENPLICNCTVWTSTILTARVLKEETMSVCRCQKMNIVCLTYVAVRIGVVILRTPVSGHYHCHLFNQYSSQHSLLVFIASLMLSSNDLRYSSTLEPFTFLDSWFQWWSSKMMIIKTPSWPSWSTMSMIQYDPMMLMLLPKNPTPTTSNQQKWDFFLEILYKKLVSLDKFPTAGDHQLAAGGGATPLRLATPLALPRRLRRRSGCGGPPHVTFALSKGITAGGLMDDSGWWIKMISDRECFVKFFLFPHGFCMVTPWCFTLLFPWFSPWLLVQLWDVGCQELNVVTANRNGYTEQRAGRSAQVRTPRATQRSMGDITKLFRGGVG